MHTTSIATPVTADAATEVPGLQAEVDALRESHPETRALYLAVCRRLFFGHGITPTANKLYQLVRKGSMSAPVEALNTFWESVRSLSRVRIDHPDIPDDLKGAAGDLMGTLWNAARDAANANLDAYRAEMRAEVEVAVRDLNQADLARDAAVRTVERLEVDAARALEVMGSLQDTVRARDISIAEGAARLDQASSDLRVERSALGDMRSAQERMVQEHAEAVRIVEARVHLAEDRLRDQEKRALLEIDRERQAAIKVQKDLDSVRASLERNVEQHRVETTGLHKQVADARQAAGVLEGRLESLAAERDKGDAMAIGLQAQLTESVANLSVAVTAAATLQAAVDAAAIEIVDLREKLEKQSAELIAAVASKKKK